MIRLSALALCMALPAGASTVALDPGDQGVQWVPGVGFRAVDGLDSYGGGKAPCPVSLVYKDPVEDQVVVERKCTQAPVTFATLDMDEVFEDFAEDSYRDLVYTSTGYNPPTGTPTTVTPLGTPTTTTSPCCGTITTTTVVGTPTPATVPLPAPLLLLIGAMTALFGLHRRKA